MRAGGRAPTPQVPRTRRTLAWALVGAAALFGCDVAEPTPEQERETLTDTASAQVGERLASALTRARRAIERASHASASSRGCGIVLSGRQPQK